jgi:signal transduction histidine kinase/CheY-like chemotaxis protein
MVDARKAHALHHDLRRNLLPWMIVPIVVAADVAILLDLESLTTPSLFGCAMALLALAVVTWVLRSRSGILAGWALTLGLTAIITASTLSFPSGVTMPFLVYPITVGAILLGSGAAILLAIVASAGLVGLHCGSPATSQCLPALSGHILALLSLAYLLRIAQRPERTLLTWAWEGYEQARRHLEQARDRQLELKQALEDLALANSQTIRLNEMLKAAREAVDEARRAKEEFVAKVSHELRTPLNMIIGFSDMILETPHVYSRRLPPALLADVAAIRRNSQHLASLVDDVLDLAEADMGRTHLVPEWTSISEITAEATEAVAVLFEQKGLTLTVDVPPDLPPIYCDRTRIRQVMLNVLSNAGRFTTEGGARVEACLDGGFVRVTVSDTGPGINRDKLSRLFEPFQQEDPSVRRRYGGSGLGLAISKRFVEMHGGRIWLDSDIGAGTRVTFMLPVQRPIEEDTPQRWFSPHQEYTPRTRLSLAPELRPRPRIVVWERGAALSRLVERYIEGMEPLSATTPEEALEAVERNAAVGLLINATTVGEAAYDPAVVARMPLDVPVMTCWVPERRTTVAHRGAQDYLVKPIRRTDLLESIRATRPRPRTILLVDDDPEARQLYARMLASVEGSPTVLQATDGDAALTLLRERKPDLLLLDLVMPNRDGFKVLEAKDADPAICDIPVIIISAKDPQREPIISKALIISRCQGLSARDLMDSVQAVTGALRPRVGAPAESETLVASWASG